MKQTAVEWLFDQLPDHLRLSEDGFDMFQQAKEMEKEQIIEAFKHGELPPLFVNFDAEQYYEQTYGGAK